MTSTDDYLTVPEVAARLRVSTATIRRWIDAGTLPAVKIGRAYRIGARALAVVEGEHRTSSAVTS